MNDNAIHALSTGSYESQGTPASSYVVVGVIWLSIQEHFRPNICYQMHYALYNGTNEISLKKNWDSIEMRNYLSNVVQLCGIWILDAHLCTTATACSYLTFQANTLFMKLVFSNELNSLHFIRLQNHTV